MLNSYYTVKKRLSIILVLAIFLFVVIFCRLGYIQVIWGEDLQARAFDQWTRDLPLQALRGEIYDRNGVLLVTSENSYGVYVRNKNVKDAALTAEILSSYLGVNYNTVYSKITTKGVSEVTIKRQVDAATVKVLREYNLSGVYFATESTRSYVYGDFLTQVLGFVSVDNIGQTGLEAYYNKYLTGINGYVYTQSDLIGRELYDESMFYLPAVDGLDLVLTIDYAIQAAVENIMEIAIKAHNPQNVKCIVLDVTNGQILAMASKPSYNLNDIPRDNIELLMEYSRNTLLTDVFEPGSTFKVLTAAASLEEARQGNTKAFNSSYVFRNNSNVRYVDGGKISCWTKHINGKHQNQTLADALNNSCNPIFTDIALSLGEKTMYKYLELFGYGSKTGIDYGGEQGGILVSLDSVRQGDLARIGFGQSIAVTAIQLAMATAAAVNGGILYRPYFVSEIIDGKTGITALSFSPTAINRAISAETSKELALMLEGVVKNGSGKGAYIEGYRVGGKTGTAQKYGENGAVAVGKYVSSFIGFFPANEPKYLCLFIVDEPVGASYGSVVAAPYAKMVFEQIINIYNIPPQG